MSEILDTLNNEAPGIYPYSLLIELDDIIAHKLSRLNRELGYAQAGMPDTLSEYYQDLGLITLKVGINV